MSEPNTAIRHLNALLQLDIDATLAYTQAIERVEIEEIKKVLIGFRRDHERHVEELSAQILQLGGTPTKRTADVKGFFIEKFTAIRSMMGVEGAIKAMKMNEELTSATYEKAMGYELPATAAALVKRNYADEDRHLEFMERALEMRIWEATQKRTG